MRFSLALSVSFGFLLPACGDTAEVATSAGGSGAGGEGGASTSTGGAGGVAGTGGSAGGGAAGAGGTAGAAGTGGTAAACAGKTGLNGDLTFKIMSSGEERTILLHVPPENDPTKAVPLILAFHGYTENASKMRDETGFADKAGSQGFIVAYPEGKAYLGLQAWNAGTCCGGANADDVTFTKDMIAAIEKDYCIDDRRIFAAGFSNGGMLSHRLACELSDRIAAIAAGSGTIAIDTCNPSRPVPVLHMHGTSDPIVPFGGGLFAKSVPDTISGWVTRNGCASAATSVYMQGSAHCEEYTGCMAGASVQLCTVEGGGHEWYRTTDMDDSDRALMFFSAHPMP